MRALCGSIITAGALIGLGLAALGFGIRFANAGIEKNTQTNAVWGATSMTIALIVLLVMVAVGLGIAFVGLAFHHERRHRETLHHNSLGGTTTRMPV